MALPGLFRSNEDFPDVISHLSSLFLRCKTIGPGRTISKRREKEYGE